MNINILLLNTWKKGNNKMPIIKNLRAQDVVPETIIIRVFECSKDNAIIITPFSILG